jgi:hypothetical protein
MSFPHLRLRRPTTDLLDLPWERPLEAWPADTLPFRDIPVGPSRHCVRFLTTDLGLVALKELPLEVGRSEYDVLRRLDARGLPAVRALGIAEAEDRGSAILVTDYLAHSLQYRRLLTRLPAGPGPFRDRLLDAMASLLVDLHRGGVFWGDCSLANTLFRRDGDKIQAYLVDAETSEIHPTLSHGQRAVDLEILVENVAYGLADLAMVQKRPEDLDEAIGSAEGVHERYLALWDELTATPELMANDRQAIRARVRRLNDLGFWVDEIELEPTSLGDRVRMTVAVTNRTFHARRLERLTGLVALEGQARLLLNDLREYAAWLEYYERQPISEQRAAQRWVDEVLEPTLDELKPLIGRERDPLQAYCDVLEQKWILSESAQRDVGLRAAIEAYLHLGAPGPEASEAAEAAAAAGSERSVTGTGTIVQGPATAESDQAA